MASTAADLKAELEKLGVSYPAKARKAELEQLLADATASEPTDSSSEDAAEAVGAEGPTDLTPDPTVAPPDYDGPVLLKPLMRKEGKVLPAGAPVPAGLGEADLERLEKLGIIAGGVSPAQTGFEVFPGKDGYYWHLRAENGEVVARGEGFSSEQGAKRSIEAVKQAVADAG